MSLTSVFSDIANAIRSKTGDSGTMTPAQMPDNIMNIQGDSYDFGIKVKRSGSGALEDCNFFKTAPKIGLLTNNSSAEPYWKDAPLRLCIGSNIQFTEDTSGGGIFGGFQTGNVYIANDIYIDGFSGAPVKNVDWIMEYVHFNCNSPGAPANLGIYLNDSIESAVGAFTSVWLQPNVDVHIHIPNNIKEADYMFSCIRNFRGDVIEIPSSMVNMGHMFEGLLYENSAISEIRGNMSNVYYSSYAFDSVHNAQISNNLFINNCRIGDNLWAAEGMFYGSIVRGRISVGARPDIMDRWFDYLNGNSEAGEQLTQVCRMFQNIRYVDNVYKDVPNLSFRITFDNQDIMNMYVSFMNWNTYSYGQISDEPGNNYYCTGSVPAGEGLFFRYVGM